MKIKAEKKKPVRRYQLGGGTVVGWLQLLGLQAQPSLTSFFFLRGSSPGRMPIMRMFLKSISHFKVTLNFSNTFRSLWNSMTEPAK